MTDKLIISAYGSHNAAVSMYYKGAYTVVEVERWLNTKNAGLTFYLTSQNPQLVFDEICQYLLDKAGRTEVDLYIQSYMGKVVPKFKCHKTIKCDHHLAHAACAFYQSPYDNALVFTYDGGGDGGFFNVYLAERNGESTPLVHRTNGLKQIGRINQDLGFPYMVLADYLKDIKKESLSIGNLVYAGKLMGLCSYGNVHEEWLPHFDKFYDTFNYGGDSFLGGAEARFKALPELFKSIGVDDFNLETSSFEGQFAWDIAATTQAAFERQFFKYAQSYLDQYPDLPVALSGGCALNVLLNTKLLQLRNGNVYVPPNTNDCGISVGAILWHNAPKEQVDLTYSGLPVMDDNRFAEFMESGAYTVRSDIGAKEIARFIADGNILGVVQGNSEHGSRALGNRSIICNPIAGMKDTLNHKVKNREWYRPFAPIVRTEDAHKYFNFHGTESRHMVYVAEVKDEWKETLPAITHEDGTGRLQTLSRDQNPLIYDIITEFEPLAGHGVILNTSFNVNGKPILTRLSDALHILSTSQLDAVYYKGNFIFRRGEDKNYFKVDAKPDSGETAIYLLEFGSLKSTGWYREHIETCLAHENTRVIIICDEQDIKTFSPLAGDKVTVHGIGIGRHYYSKVIKELYPEYKTTKQYAQYLQPLWAKEAMRDISPSSTYHLVVDGSIKLNAMFPAELTRLLKTLKQGDQDSCMVSASIAGVNRTWGVNATYYHGYSYGGRYEAMDWLLTNYEGHMNWHLSLGKHCTEGDLFTYCAIENTDRLRPYYV